MKLAPVIILLSAIVMRTRAFLGDADKPYIRTTRVKMISSSDLNFEVSDELDQSNQPALIKIRQFSEGMLEMRPYSEFKHMPIVAACYRFVQREDGMNTFVYVSYMSCLCLMYMSYILYNDISHVSLISL